MNLFPETGIRQLLAYAFILVLFGSLGFYVMGGENWSIFDSIYMTIITLSTVGFGEIKELNIMTRLWTIVVIMFGVGIFMFLGSQFVQEMAQATRLRRKRMEKKINRIKNHYIICGFGRMGEVIADELSAKKQPFVVIEQRNLNVEILEEKGYLHILGDATNEDILIQAGLKNAQGVAIVLGSDPDNLFVTMTVKTLNPDIFILTRCSTIGSNRKFKRAGADKVVNPYVAGGHRIAELLATPELSDSIEITTDIDKDTTLDLAIEHINLANITELQNLPLKESQLRENFQLIVVGIIDPGGEVELNPNPDYILKPNDHILIMGKKEKLEIFKAKLCSSK